MADTIDFTNKTVYEEQRLRLKASYDELDRAREHFEQQRTNSLAYFNKQKQAELDQRMLERAQQLGDKGFTQDQIREHQKLTSDWLQQRQKAVDNYRSGDFKSDIKAGNLATFDKKAADLVDKGNTLTSVAFLSHAAELSRQQYSIHTERQEALADQIEKARESGDERAVKMLEARKDYEDVAYERDTAASVLNKHAALYGVDSKQYRDQQAAYEELSLAADQLHEKLSDTIKADSQTTETYDTMVDNMLAEINQQDADKAAQTEAKAIADAEAQKQAEIDAQAQTESEQQKLEAPVAELAAADNDRVQEIIEDGESESEADAEFEAQEAAYQQSWENNNPEFDDDDDDYLVLENRAEQQHEEDLRRQLEGTYEEDPDADAERALDHHLNGDDDIDDYDDDITDERTAEEIEEQHGVTANYREARERSPVNEQRSTFTYDVTGTFFREQLEDGTRDDFSQEYRGQMDQSWDRLNAAYNSGDHEAILDAQDDLQKRIETFNGYIDDREELKDKLGEMKSSGDAYLESDNDSQRESAREDYKQAYKDADAYADKMQAEEKPWAENMRQQVQSTASDIEKKEDDKQQEAPKSADTNDYRQPSDKEAADHTEGPKADQADSQKADKSGEREESQGNSLKSARQEVDSEKADEKSSQISSNDVERVQKEIERQRQADAQKERETQH